MHQSEGGVNTTHVSKECKKEKTRKSSAFTPICPQEPWTALPRPPTSALIHEINYRGAASITRYNRPTAPTSYRTATAHLLPATAHLLPAMAGRRVFDWLGRIGVRLTTALRPPLCALRRAGLRLYDSAHGVVLSARVVSSNRAHHNI